MDVYVFIRAAAGEAVNVMNRLVEGGFADRAGVTTGDADVVARIDGVEDFDALLERLLALQDVDGIAATSTAGAIEPDWAAARMEPIPMPIHLPPPSPLDEAFVSIATEPEATERVIEALGAVDGVRAIALLTGERDLLVQVQGEGLEGIANTVLRKIRTIAGIRSTSTSMILALTPLEGSSS